MKSVKLTIEEWDAISLQWIPEEVLIDTSKLVVNEENLINEACETPALMVYYGEMFAKLKAQLTRKEEMVKRVAAGIALKLRNEGVKPNDAVKERVLISQDYNEALAHCDATRIDALRAEAYWRTAQQKAELIKMIGYRQNSEIKRGE